jgi:hypothetical protein
MWKKTYDEEVSDFLKQEELEMETREIASAYLPVHYHYNITRGTRRLQSRAGTTRHCPCTDLKVTPDR